MKAIVVLCLAFAVPGAFASSVRLDARTIIKRSVGANEKDYRAAPRFSYYKRVLDSGAHTFKTYHVFMMEGSPYECMVAVNDKPLSPEQQKEEQKKLDQTFSRRQNESKQDRKERVSKYQDERKRDNILMQQLTKAMDFTLLGQEKLGPYNVYVLEAAPLPDYVPPSDEAKVLRGMKGKLWIDQNTFQWVKIEAQVVEPVAIKGFLARVEPGTRFEMEKMPVEDGIWMPKYFSMRADYKVLFLFSNSKNEEDSFFGYRQNAPLPIATEARR